MIYNKYDPYWFKYLRIQTEDNGLLVFYNTEKVKTIVWVLFSVLLSIIHMLL